MQRLTGRRKKTAGRNSSRASKTVSIYLENHHEGTGLADISEDAILEDEDLQDAGAVVDVLANLTCLSRAKGELGQEIGENGNPIATARQIPDKSKVLGRKLGKSVRNGHLNVNRAMAAARWVDKEIRKLIDAIVEHGDKVGKSKVSIKYKTLFDNTDQIFEALSGTLKTAKKRKVVKFKGEVLFQGVHDDVVITLLKDSIKDSTVNTYTYGQVRDTSGGRNQEGGADGAGGGGKGGGAARKAPTTTGFDSASLANTNSKCHICTKTVYAMEFIGASNKAFHKNCFRCKVCTGKLRPDTYATMDDVFYCKTHYDEAFKKAGGYNFSKLDEAAEAGSDAKAVSGNLTHRASQRAAGGVKSRTAAALAGFGSLGTTTYATPGSTIPDEEEEDDDLLPDSLDAIDGVGDSGSGGGAAEVETSAVAAEAVVVGGGTEIEIKPLKVPALFSAGEAAAKEAQGEQQRAAPVYKFQPRTMFNVLQSQSTTSASTKSSADGGGGGGAGAAAAAADAAPVHAAAAVMQSLGAELQSSSTDDALASAHAAATPVDRKASLDMALALPEDAPALKKKLRQSVRTGTLDEGAALSAARFVDSEMRKLIAAIQKHGAEGAGEGGDKYGVTYGKLATAANDDFESLVGLLRTAKKQSVVAYKAAMLMRVVHEDLMITLLTDTIADSDLDTYTFKQIRHVSCRATTAATAPQGQAAAALAAEIIMEGEVAPRPAAAAAAGSASAGATGKPPPLTFSGAEMVLDLPSEAKMRRGSTLAEQEEDAVIDVLSSLVVLASPIAEEGEDDDDDEEEDEEEDDDDEGGGGGGGDGGDGGGEGDADVKSAGDDDAEAAEGEDAIAPLPAAEEKKPKKVLGAVAAAAAAVEERKGAGKVLAPSPLSAAKPKTFGSRPPPAHKAWGKKSKRAKPPPQSPVMNAYTIPEDAPVLNRTLAASVRRGELSASRAVLAARWVDKEIRKLIGLVVANGTGPEGARVITYGELFKLAEDSMEALSGTLKTAKKQKVVKFEAEMLFQGQSDDVVITLLKDSIPDSNAETYTYKQVRNVSRRIKPKKAPTTSGFGASLANSNSKCHICTKTVYAMEFMGASGKRSTRTVSGAKCATVN